jgi:hypothetical protein
MNGYAIFNYSGLYCISPDLVERSGQTVLICREIVDSLEISLEETDKMYLIQFKDGYQDGAFEDELTPTHIGWDNHLHLEFGQDIIISDNCSIKNIRGKKAVFVSMEDDDLYKILVKNEDHCFYLYDYELCVK